MMWEEKRLGELAEIGRGSSPRPIIDQRYFEGGVIPWIKIADATDASKFIYKTKEHVNEYGASFSRKLSPGSLILAASGTLGFPKFLGVVGCIHDGWLYFTNYRGISPEYLYYQLITLRGFFNALSYGAAIQNINTGIVKNTKILLPQLPVQQKIADILSAYDDLIENNNRRIELLEKAAQCLYKEWFVRFRFPNYKETKFENGLPQGWRISKLSELVNTQYGYTASAESENVGPKFLRITDVAQKNLNWDSVPYCKIEEKELLKYLLEEGDILVARTGATAGYAKRINKNSPQAIFASFLVRLKPKNKQLGIMIGMVVESEQYKSFIQAIATGAAQPQANAQILTLFSMVVPDDNTVDRFNSIVDPINDQIENLLIENRNLIKQRDLLLPRLVSGKIEI